MFIGHFGIGFGAKSFAPKVSLGVLFVGAQFVDLLWPTLLQLTELSLHGIYTSSSKKAENVTHVSGTKCYLSLRSGTMT